MESIPPQPLPPKRRKRLRRFDVTILAAMLLLSLLIALVWLGGDRVNLRVTQFSWADRVIGVGDRAFELSFNRPVDRESVKKSLSIVPSLAGKTSWTGKTLVYTLSELPLYGNNYQLKLAGAKKLNSDRAMETYTSSFKSRDRAFVYLGLADKERGRLMLVNATQKSKTPLTPRDLIVTNFKIYPDGDKILFSAFTKGSRNPGIETQQLYTVTTGLQYQTSEKKPRIARIERFLEAKDYQNRQFDLSANGKAIVIWRVNRKDATDSGLWAISEGGQPRALGIPANNNFIVAPDGNTVAVAQRDGIAIVPLTQGGGASKFLRGYEAIVGFSQDGSQKLLVRDNQDYTRSLVLLDRDGTTKELFQTLAPVINCAWEPREERLLYCLKIGLVQRGEAVQQEAFLAATDLKTVQEVAVLVLPNYQDVQMSMSPDGVALLFDQIATTTATGNTEIKSDRNDAIVDASLWLLPLPELAIVQANTKPPKVLPEELDYPGYKPHWIP
jgi:hypothetical protein